MEYRKFFFIGVCRKTKFRKKNKEHDNKIERKNEVFDIKKTKDRKSKKTKDEYNK